MKDMVFITGNQNKADALARWLGISVEHQKIDQNEIQSLDLRDVVEHKARQAFEVIKAPVLVEDVALSFTAMGRLPGTFIKWFLEEIGNDGLCRLADGLPIREAEAAIIYGLFDGQKMKLFEARQQGTIAEKPRGDAGFGWNPVFIPDGSSLTYAEMDEATFKKWNIRAHAIEKLKQYLAM